MYCKWCKYTLNTHISYKINLINTALSPNFAENLQIYIIYILNAIAIN